MAEEQRPLDPSAGQAAFEEWRKYLHEVSGLPYSIDWNGMSTIGRTSWEKIAFAAIKFHQDSTDND